MRVLHCISGINFGGAEQSLLHLVRSSKHDHRVLVVSSLLGRQADFEGAHVQVYALGLGSGFPPIHRWISIFRELRSWKPELIQGWMAHGNICAYFLKKVLPQPVKLAWCLRQSFYALKKESRGVARLIRLAAKCSNKTDILIYNSEISKEHHIALGYQAKRDVVIDNGLDVKALEQVEQSTVSRKEFGLPDNAFIIGSVMRYHAVKDPNTLLEAFKTVHETLARTGEKTCLVLIGHGQEKSNSELMQALSRLGLSEHVFLFSVHPRHLHIVSLFDVFVLSSRSESFPNALLEAVGLGVPCVTTRVGVAAEIVGDAGMVVPREDSQALASAILAMKNQEAVRLNVVARRKFEVREKYNLSTFSSHFDKVYEDLLLGLI